MGTTDCRTALAQLQSFLALRSGRQVELAAALEHVRECPACRSRMGHLERILEAETLDEDPLTCQDCEDLLPRFLAAEALGAGSDLEWADVRRHLEACSHCTEAYESLSELAAFGFGEKGAQPPRIPEPDLSFLQHEASRETGRQAVVSTAPTSVPPAQSAAQPSTSSPQPALWERTTQGLYRLTSAIMVLVERMAASFGTLTAPLTVQPAPVPTYRGRAAVAHAEEMRDFRQLVELPHPETNVTLKVSLGPVSEGRASLALAVNTLEPPLPIALARATLRDADGALLEGGATGGDGVVLFRDLDTGEYSIRVEYGGQAWELPLSLAPSSASKTGSA